MNDLFYKLDSLFQNYDSFVIMGHNNPDLDSYGSALALYYRLINMNKKPYIFLDTEENEYSTLMTKAINLIEDVNYTNSQITDYLGKTLLIITDVQQKNRLEYENIMNIFTDYIVLDHHIKDKKGLKGAKLMYINSNLSSMVELMTYYLDYSDIKVNSYISTIMLAALEIDTNNYNLKTTSRTYKAASLLVEMGADITSKLELLKESKEDFVKRADYIKNSYTINNHIAICILPDIAKPEFLAEIADDLLSFEDIDQSFAIAKLNNLEYGISARALEGFDVLRIIKKLSGGGTPTAAAAKTTKDILQIKEIIMKTVR